MKLPDRRQRTAVIGYSIALCMLSYLLMLAIGLPLIIPALAAWVAVILSLPGMGRSARKQALVLLGAGAAMIGWALGLGTHIRWAMALGSNLPLLAMFTAVSFLSLTNPTENRLKQPRGNKGFLSTLLTCHLLGAIINISIIFVVGDRLAREQKVTLPQALTMMRGFTAAAFWSPFFVATGAALTYAPGSQWIKTCLPGLILALLLFCVCYFDMKRFTMEDFEGYPLRYESLTIPLLLAISVLICHKLLPGVRVLTLITLIAPIGAFLLMKPRPRIRQTRIYIGERLASISSQFALFLAAGVFSSGLVAIIDSYPDLLSLQLNQFSPLLFMIFSGLMILAALIGVHPVVSIALVSPFLQPLGINPNQLAFLFLSVWGISTGTSPLSGVGLAMVGRYHVSGMKLLKENRFQLVAMWILAGLINILWFN